MSLDECFTVGALYKTGSNKLPVSASLVSASFGCFSLRYCHNLHLLYFYKKDLLIYSSSCSKSSRSLFQRGSISRGAQSHSSAVIFFPHLGQRPRQSGEQRSLDGSSRSKEFLVVTACVWCHLTEKLCLSRISCGKLRSVVTLRRNSSYSEMCVPSLFAGTIFCAVGIKCIFGHLHCGACRTSARLVNKKNGVSFF